MQAVKFTHLPNLSAHLRRHGFRVELEVTCSGFGFFLSNIAVTGDSTGTAFSVNVFSVFDATTTRTPGSTGTLTNEPFPLLPTHANSSSPENPSKTTQPTTSSSGPGKTGGAVGGLSALQSLNAGVVGAVAAVAIVMG